MILNNKHLNSYLTTLIGDIEEYFNLRKGSFHVKDYNIENGNPGVSLGNIVLQAAADRSDQEPLSIELKAQFRQWIEYLTVYGHLLQSKSTSHQALKELNGVLEIKSYLTSFYCQTLIDAVVYRSLHKIVSNFSFQEKEQFAHLSRWFNTVQADPRTRGSRSLVTFSRTPLY